jgi:hypothetical protein
MLLYRQTKTLANEAKEDAGRRTKSGVAEAGLVAVQLLIHLFKPNPNACRVLCERSDE